MARTLLHTFRNPDLARMAEIAAKYGVRMGPKLKAFVPTLDEVDDAHRDLYVEDTDKDGNKRFRLDAEGLEDVTGLKSTVATLRRENGQLKAKVKPLESIADGEDPEAIIEAGRTALEAQKSGKPTPEVENVRNTMKAAHDREVNKLQTKIKGMTDTLRSVLISNEVRAQAADPSIKGNAALLLPIIEREAEIVEEEGEDGTPRFAARLKVEGKELLDGKTGQPLTIKGRLAQLREKEEYSGAFEGTGMSGSDTPPDGGRGTPTPPRNTTAPAGAKERKRSSNDYGAI